MQYNPHMPFESSFVQSRVTEWLLRRVPASGVRRVVPLAAAIASETGTVREENQDRAVIARSRSNSRQEYSVIAVADGIGGMRGGAQCAALTIGAFLAAVEERAQAGLGTSDEWVRAAAHAANQAVFSRFRGSGGSTLVAMLARPGLPVCWLSVGDSRVYGAAGSVLTQLSVDDTIAGQLGKGPESAESGQTRLLQFVGMGDDLEPHFAHIPCDPIDALLLTTDGVHYLGGAPGWLDMVVHHAPDPGYCVKRLVDLAKWCGGPDNATVAMISLTDDREFEDLPTFPCLEVWDAFGELQLPVSRGAGTGQVRSAPFEGAGATPVVPEAPEPAPKSDDGLSKPEGGAQKTRRGKSSRKGKHWKNEQDRPASESAEGKEPQLHMEFPTKPN